MLLKVNSNFLADLLLMFSFRGGLNQSYRGQWSSRISFYMNIFFMKTGMVYNTENEYCICEWNWNISCNY